MCSLCSALLSVYVQNVGCGSGRGVISPSSVGRASATEIQAGSSSGGPGLALHLSLLSNRSALRSTPRAQRRPTGLAAPRQSSALWRARVGCEPHLVVHKTGRPAEAAPWASGPQERMGGAHAPPALGRASRRGRTAPTQDRPAAARNAPPRLASRGWQATRSSRSSLCIPHTCCCFVCGPDWRRCLEKLAGPAPYSCGEGHRFRVLHRRELAAP